MMLEDSIQRTHNKIEYDRSLGEDDIRQKYLLLDNLQADLKTLKSKL